MYACIRWADLNPDEDDEDPRIWSHHTDYDEVRTVIGHKEHPPGISLHSFDAYIVKDFLYENYILK